MAVLTGFLSGVHERLVLTVLSTGFLSCFKIHRSLARLSSFTQERVNAERPAHPRARCASQTGLWLGFAPRVVQHVNTPAPPECRLGPCLGEPSGLGRELWEWRAHVLGFTAAFLLPWFLPTWLAGPPVFLT